MHRKKRLSWAGRGFLWVPKSHNPTWSSLPKANDWRRFPITPSPHTTSQINIKTASVDALPSHRSASDACHNTTHWTEHTTSPNLIFGSIEPYFRHNLCCMIFLRRCSVFERVMIPLRYLSTWYPGCCLEMPLTFGRQSLTGGSMLLTAEIKSLEYHPTSCKRSLLHACHWTM